ncbi:MAG: hypothetical protein ACHQDF_06430 [Chitinophagales bacterium]
MKMVSKKISAIYTGSLILISCIISTILIALLLIRYDQLIPWITVEINKPEIASLLREKALTFEKFHDLQKLSLTGLFLLPPLFYLFHKFRGLLLNSILLISGSIRKAFAGVIAACRAHSKRERIIFLTVLFLIFLRSLGYIIFWDLQYDEMWAYNYFTASPFYFSFFMYSNYPLYEISTHLFKWLPFPEKINIRLPVLIMGLMSAALLYSCLFRLFKKQLPALAGMVLFACMPPVTTYMILGRGVVFELFFAIAAVFSLLEWLRYPEQKDKLIIYILANILGMYSMPTHLYYWVCLLFLAFTVNRSGKIVLRKFFLANLWIIPGVFLCYLPILLGSGISFLGEAITGGIGTFRSTWQKLPLVMNGISDFITGFDWGLTILILVCILLILFRKHFARSYPLIAFSLIICVLPGLLFIIQRFYVPVRTVAFICLSIPLIVSVLIHELQFAGKPALYVFVLLAGLFAAGVSHLNGAINWSRKLDRQVKELSQFFLDKGISTCYDNSPGSHFFYYYPGIEYYFRQSGRTIRLTISDSRSLRYKAFSGSDHYDCIISLKDSLHSGQKEDYNVIYSRTGEDFEVLEKQR